MVKGEKKRDGREEERAYGLGMTASSLKDVASGVWARKVGLNGCTPPRGVSGRPSLWSL